MRMTRTTRRGRRLRAALIGAGALVVALPLMAGAAPPETLVLHDMRGDAGGVNDQGEGLVGNSRGPVSFAQADLTSLRLAPLRLAGQPAHGFSVTFSLVGKPGAVPSSVTGETTYAVVMQPTPDCRLSIHYVARSADDGEGLLVVGNGCSTLFLQAPLTSSVEGTSVRVDVPYDVGPSALRAGEKLDDYYTYTSDGVVDLDTIYTRPDYVLPG